MDVETTSVAAAGSQEKEELASKQSKAPPSPRASLRRGAWNYNGQLRISTIYIIIIYLIYIII